MSWIGKEGKMSVTKGLFVIKNEEKKKYKPGSNSAKKVSVKDL